MLDNLKQYNFADVLLLLILITLPLPEHWNSKVLLLTTLFVLVQYYRNFKINFPKIGWFYLFFFLLVALSYFWSQQKAQTLTAIISLLPFLLFVVGFQQFFSFKSIDKILNLSVFIYLLYGFIWIVIALFRFLETQNTNTFFYHDLTAPFGANAVYIALIFGLLYVFILYKILFRSSKTSLLNILQSTFLFGFQFLFSSKLILVALILITVLFFFKYHQKSSYSRKIFLFGTVLILSIIALLGMNSFTKNRFKEIIDHQQIDQVFTQDYFGRGYYWNGLTLRLFQLRCFYEIEKEIDFNSFLGTGYSASQPLLNKKYAHYDLYRGPSGEGENDGYFIYNFHNQYAQLLIELGFFGGILIVLMLYFYVLFPIKKKNILLLAIGLLFLSFALTESFLYRQKGIVAFIIFPLLANSYSTLLEIHKTKQQ